ncbi:disease resistance protein RPV1-like [Syzygium oleosum]|uniref:disease resistance protein RPV1-like n=1 Tax=Syzygium oleosum TaxID=219896 RepID=UPI0024B880BA|nr:disease resistance protein RPV1-like [Syzygium oleosum]XP_056165492.1 disease resistance protein RPV1-like [Syzygium oleosum]XP_056165493.1 disease resistance protein RPV1-like [Syzygium oleosum]XP_056165494.1 disease resistance protein RPV1-like [Syzygium oleosum]XP_056165495.1 disease resistance protein RPV1-like [Syzygium oleosum]XP_056165496.1 disease resistance protein RPV1-like [Syzygium oleosum]XP_056165497.1 disease resistance protein RPV1-like [Syzygium oleosum]XP_056165498.1 dis
MDKELSQGKRKRAEEEGIEGASPSSFISPVLTGQGDDQYDVFLSFRGSDTRQKFTDHLYHRLVSAGTAPLSVFKDDNSIPIGEEFGSQILGAISRSKISIPIISKNYATSKWCLRELIHMMDRKNSMSHTVLPIFYEVKPSDVRDLKGSFGEAFRLSQVCFEEKDILEGQRALYEVSLLHGWESEKVVNGHEGELVEKVVEKILSELRQDFQLDVTKHLVGIEDRVNEIRKWVDTPTSVARMIGIYGMGGIGKTTLAKEIYNQLSNDFVHRSFLADIRETVHRNNISYLQKQLIEDILPNEQVKNVDDGINIIKSRFKGKKVLILLDDIDHKNHLDALARECSWFMAGSVIIVTTRNEAVLDQSEFKEVYKYELNELDEEHAFLLFNRHAFRAEHSPRDFEGISRDIISTMGGLPLALQVVGSYLYKKTNQKVWEDVRKQLKNQPYRDVQKILQISYDALEDGHKQIFLDIACFFIGETSNYAMYMWEGCRLYPSQGIEELKLRCLIKIGDYGQFEMHDQLRDLGRSIFCLGQPPEKRSGPWDDDYEGVTRVLRQDKSPFSVRDWMRAASSGDSSNELLSEVRWLEFKGSDLSLPTTNLHLPKSSVLDLSRSGIKRRLQRICICRISQCCVLGDDPPLPTTSLHLPNLSVLELVCSDITGDWEGWSSFMTAKRLQVLDLTWCHGLRCTPDLSTFTQLKILTLRHCFRLEHLHPSIGKLKSLVSLDLRGCYSLEELPEEVGELKDLEELMLDFGGITEIPTSVGSLRKLKTLRAFSCRSLREIPSSIGDLQNLQQLDLRRSRLEKLPNAIGGLKNLRTLDLRTGKLMSLFSLDLSGCNSLKELPEEVGKLKDLEELVLDESGITEIPTSIGSLTKLKNLSAVNCKSLREIPSSIGDLKNLQHLNLSHCERLKELPEEVGELKDLEELLLDFGGIAEIPTSIGSLRKLKKLSAFGCKSLREIPSSIGDLQNLQHLELSGSEIEKLPSAIGDLSSLKHLYLWACDKLRSLPQLSSLIHLEELHLSTCHLLEDIPELPSRLLKLSVRKCGKLILLKLDGLKNLEELSIKECSSIERLDLSQLIRLKQLRAEHCDSLVEIQSHDNLEFLEDIFIYDCNSIKRLLCAESRCLKELRAITCNNLVEIRGLDGAKFLEALDFGGCESMETLPNLMGCEKLRSLNVRDCKKLTQLRGLEKLDLIDLNISGCDSLEVIPELSGI